MKHKYLTERERYQIESLLKVKTSVKDIACILGKCKATIYNEIKRGMVSLIDTDLIEKPQYCADVAQRKAEYNATNKGRDLKLGNDYEYVRCVTELIREKNIVLMLLFNISIKLKKSLLALFVEVLFIII